jgi:hypothetical protein
LAEVPVMRIRVSDTFCTLSRRIPVALFWIVPPVQSASAGAVGAVALFTTTPPQLPAELPVTVKLPVLFCSRMPLAPPLAETLRKL